MSPDQTNSYPPSEGGRPELPPELEEGHFLAGRYEVEELIGEGAMAEVYRARDGRLARRVALKVLRPQFSIDPQLRRRFEEEARAAAHVSHPNVVAVYDAGEEDNRAFIVMELVGGRTLSDFIRRGPMDVALVRSIGIQVLGALAAAHQRGLLHRDIKPANVLVDEDGTAKVADFGIAKAIEPSAGDQTTRNIVLGTPSYLAPERADGHPATAQSDLYSVGVMLYEALTGVRPYEADSPIAITVAAREGRYVPIIERRPDVPDSFARAVEQAMSPDPGLRYASASDMAEALVDPSKVRPLPGAGAAAGAAATVPLGGLAGAAAAGAAGAAGAATSATALAPTPPTGTPAVGGWSDGSSGTGGLSTGGTGLPPSRHRGVAVLVGIGIALLLTGVVLAAILLPGRPHSPGQTSSTVTTLRPTSSSQTTATTSSGATTSSNPTTSNPTTSSTVPTTTAPTTTSRPTTSTSPTTTASTTSTTTNTTSTTSTTSTTTSSTTTSTTSTTAVHTTTSATTLPHTPPPPHSTS